MVCGVALLARQMLEEERMVSYQRRFPGREAPPLRITRAASGWEVRGEEVKPPTGGGCAGPREG